MWVGGVPPFLKLVILAFLPLPFPSFTSAPTIVAPRLDTIFMCPLKARESHFKAI